MKEFDAVVERLKRIKGVRTDADLAKALGLSPTAYNNRKQSGSIPYEAVCRLCAEESISLDRVFGINAEESEAAVALSSDERRLVDALLVLTDEDRKAVLRHASGLARLLESG